MSIIKPEQIIWSADVNLEGLKEVIDTGALPEGTGIKLDRLFFEDNKKDVIEYCQEKGYIVFADAKIVEIPDKTIGIAGKYLEHRPWMLNVMAGVCSTGVTDADEAKKNDALKRFAEACAIVGTRSCAVTVLTSKSEAMCKREFKVDPIDQVLEYVGLMKECGLTDIVCSPKEAAEIRKHHEFDNLSINTPGVRLPDTAANDQQRIMTPAKALAAGSNRLVIGRNITEGEGDIAERVKKNYDRILANIAAGA